jgi:hypothetical protein
MASKGGVTLALKKIQHKVIMAQSKDLPGGI